MAVTESDASCTIGQARTALEEAKRRGLDGWSRLNPSFTRQQAWDIFSGAVAAGSRGDDEVLERRGLIAANIRREFGTDGKKKGLKSPKKPRRRKAGTW